MAMWAVMEQPNLSKESYQLPLSVSVVLHVIVISAIFISFGFTTSIKPELPPGTNIKPIDAIAINQTAVSKEVTRLKDEAKLKREKELAHQRKLQDEAKAAKLARLNEQKKLADLKAKQIKMQQIAKAKAKAEAAKLVKIKQQQLAAKKRLDDLEKHRAAKIKAQQKAIAEKKQMLAKSEAKKLALQQQLQKQLQQEQSNLASNRQKQTTNIVKQYSALINNSIRANVPPMTSKHSIAKLLVTLMPGGNVVSVDIAKSSGDAAFDQAWRTAVYKASPLPVPSDVSIFDSYFRHFSMTTTMTPNG